MRRATAEAERGERTIPHPPPPALPRRYRGPTTPRGPSTPTTPPNQVPEEVRALEGGKSTKIPPLGGGVNRAVQVSKGRVDARAFGLQESMFPPRFPSEEGPPLHHCMRLLPTHGLGFGGFFVAAITRATAPLFSPPWTTPPTSSGVASSPPPLTTPPIMRSPSLTRLLPRVPGSVRRHLISFFGLAEGSEAICARLAVTASTATEAPLLLSLVPTLAMRMRRESGEGGGRGEEGGRAGEPPTPEGFELLGVGQPLFCR